MTTPGDTYFSAAYEHVESKKSGIWEQVEKLDPKDATAPFSDSFVEACGLISEFDLAKIVIKLKAKYKSFTPRAWKKEVASRRPQRDESGQIDWKSLLIRSDSGAPKPILANAITAMRESPEWRGVLSYDQMSQRIVKVKAPDHETGAVGVWTDTDDIKAAEWLQRSGIFVTRGTAADAATAVAEENGFHPIRQYLESLKWDGEKRICRWLTTYCGVEFSEYVSQVGAKWLISAVARVMRPGCQVDTCLVLEGIQGARKSTTLKALVGEQWFTDQVSAMDSKAGSEDLPGKWVIELAELEKYSTKHEQSVIKSFISRPTDHYRASYGRRTGDYPRQCVFAGSTNKDCWLSDETGGRRWWPVRTGPRVDIEGVIADRDQLWAEAYAAYQEGQKWYLEDAAVEEAAREAQRARLVEDPWQDQINVFIDDLAERCSSEWSHSVSIAEVLKELGIKHDKFDQNTANRVAKCLTVAGYVRYREKNGGRPWRYKRP